VTVIVTLAGGQAGGTQLHQLISVIVMENGMNYSRAHPFIQFKQQFIHIMYHTGQQAQHQPTFTLATKHTGYKLLS
jgi:hypothetical protein